jgi:hypothetical protein
LHRRKAAGLWKRRPYRSREAWQNSISKWGKVNGDAGGTLRRFRSENHAQNMRKHPRHVGFKDVETNMASAGFTRFTDGITDMRPQKSGPATLCSLRKNEHSQLERIHF